MFVADEIRERRAARQLGIEIDADPMAIRARFRQIVRTAHPDMAGSSDSVDLGELSEARNVLLARAARRLFESERSRIDAARPPQYLRSEGTTIRQAARRVRGSALGDADGFRPWVPSSTPFVAGQRSDDVVPGDRQPLPGRAEPDTAPSADMRRPITDRSLLRNEVERGVEVRSRLEPEDIVLSIEDPAPAHEPQPDPVTASFTVSSRMGYTFDRRG